ncbi:ribbon-helix-helix protein, CopG family [Chlorobium sp.]|uniref:CopG family ribbon-helix-helix protein n=1 Tax=Chlorobium sp. TaxID=1095 RepID=UPI0025C3D7A3|nr:ribbon-helix-helix protein, CopG family [Chlorobium sp.]
MSPGAKKKESREQVSFKMPATMKMRVDRLAEATRRSRSFVIEEAIEHYLTMNEWQVQSINAGLSDLDKGRTVSQEEMEKLWDEKPAESQVDTDR